MKMLLKSLFAVSTLAILSASAHDEVANNVVKEAAIKEGYLSQITSPKDLKNIHVERLGSDENSSDFVVFVKKTVPLHKHMTHSETVYVLEGTGVLLLGDKKINIGPGHYVKIPKGTPHGVTVTSSMPMKVLSIQAPQFFGKDRVKVQ